MITAAALPTTESESACRLSLYLVRDYSVFERKRKELQRASNKNIYFCFSFFLSLLLFPQKKEKKLYEYSLALVLVSLIQSLFLFHFIFCRNINDEYDDDDDDIKNAAQNLFFSLHKIHKYFNTFHKQCCSFFCSAALWGSLVQLLWYKMLCQSCTKEQGKNEDLFMSFNNSILCLSLTLRIFWK